MLHGCEAMVFAYEQAERLPHRDISYAYKVHKDGADFLIDYRVAFSEQASLFSGRITGTSRRLRLPRHLHCLLDS